MWRYPGAGGWYFLTLPERISEEIQAVTGMFRKAFGSVPVVATIGKTSWSTSIFPEKKSHTYVLPLKADVRKKEGLEAGDTVKVRIQVHPRGAPVVRP